MIPYSAGSDPPERQDEPVEDEACTHPQQQRPEQRLRHEGQERGADGEEDHAHDRHDDADQPVEAAEAMAEQRKPECLEARQAAAQAGDHVRRAGHPQFLVEIDIAVQRKLETACVHEHGET